MREVTAIDTAQVLTMSSLEMVSYINSTRKAGDAEVRHDNFLPKVTRVLGGIAALKFQGYYKGANGKQSPLYNFPRREAMLMAMSYSYELQAQIFDAWEAAETALTNASVKPLS